MRRLIRFQWDCGRNGTLDGQFVATETEWKTLQDLIKSRVEIYFGEVLGKHSEIMGELDDKDLTVVTTDQQWLDRAEELGINLNVGYSPLDYPDDE